METRYSIRIPEDFRDYLLHCCPEKDCDLRDATSWWQLDRIRNIPDEYEHWAGIKNPAVLTNVDKYLFFADFAIWCWAWAIDCGDDANRGRVVSISGADRFVADSFGEFVDLSIADAGHLV